jgi:hypothetical protein
MARTKSNYTSKLQTHPLVREGAPHQETRNLQGDKKSGRENSRMTVGRKLTSTSIAPLKE